ncbi:hypothetical protein [Pararhizobium antarcticum]|uniref:hypothetical protein n=1 Tax=Pararhizobium antarcticum TaxID=1798805 RepID=UPI000AD15CF3|nr:hypothetical protein [Pararhizobium antarcticum]
MLDRDGYDFAIVENHTEVADVFTQNPLGIAVQKHRKLRVDGFDILAELENLRYTPLQIALMINDYVVEY